MSKIKLFTHGADLDGIGCVILACLAFGRENVDVEYCDYKDVDEKVRNLIVDHSTVSEYDRIYITDISVREEVAQIIDTWVDRDKIRLFDHHGTAMWLNKYGWCEVKVDTGTGGLKTCGTKLFFVDLASCGFFKKYDKHQLINITEFVQIVRDYDTWRWKEIGDEGIVCKQVNDLFHIYGREEFIEWVMDQITIFKFIQFPYFDEADTALLTQKQRDIYRYIELKNQQLHGPFKDHLGYTYAVVFAEQYFSELGNWLCELHPELDYVAMIDISRGQVSYRAIKDDIDLGGEIAHSFGGGGHKKATGSRFDLEYVQSRIMNEIFFYKADELG